MWGRKWRSRLLRTVLCFLCAFALMLPMASYVSASDSTESADDSTAAGSASVGGVTVEISFDQESYKDGETAVVTVTATNTNSYDVTDVELEYDLPDNFEVPDGGSAEQTIDSIAAGESASVTVSATVTKDENAEVVSGGSSASGISAGLIVGIVVVIIIIVVVVVVIMMLKKKGTKPPKASTAAIALILMAGVLAGCFFLANDIAEAYTDDGLAEDSDYSRVSVHDPSIVKDEETGRYYIFGSHRAWAYSDDLMSWTTFSNNLSTQFRSILEECTAWSELGTTSGTYDVAGNMWAPDVIWNESMGKYCMYLSVNGDNWCTSIALLTSDSLDGDWEYQGIVVYSGMNNATTEADASQTDIYDVLGEDADLSAYAATSYSCINAIDPCVTYDENGDLYMVYGSWSAGIYMLKLDNETGFRDSSVTYTTERDVSDAYFGTKIAGGYYCSGEAPYIIYADGYYYLFLSYAALEAVGGYQIRVYRSETIDGEYVDQNGVSAIRDSYVEMKNTNYGVKLFGSYEMSGIDTVQVAQGHNSALVDDDGTIYLVYHTRFQSESGTNETHEVRVHQLFVNEDGWLVAAPYEYSGETLSEDGYSVDDVVGTYDYIYHEPTSYYSVSSTYQLGIVGDADSTSSSGTATADTVVANRVATVSVKVSLAHEGSPKVTLNADGTITGDYNGTWEFSDGANVVMVIDDVEYKGVFLEQQDETDDRTMRMTFTILGDNVTVWGVWSDEQ